MTNRRLERNHRVWPWLVLVLSALPSFWYLLVYPRDIDTAFRIANQAFTPEVLAAIDDAFARLRRLGVPAGYLTLNEQEASRRIAQGVEFVGVATDTSIITRGAKGLIDRMTAAPVAAQG